MIPIIFFYMFYIFGFFTIPIFAFIYISFLYNKMSNNFDVLDYNFNYISYYDKFYNIKFNSNYKLNNNDSHYIVDFTPKGFVILNYDFDYGLFTYYTNNHNVIDYQYLESIALSYSKFYNCSELFIDNYKSDNDNDNDNDNHNDNDNDNNCDNNHNDNDSVFYKKYNTNNKDNKKNYETQYIKNKFKYIGNIDLFFQNISDKKLFCLSLFDVSSNLFSYYDDNICKFDQNILYDNSNNILIDFSNTIIDDLYKYSNYNNYLAYKFNNIFFKLNKNKLTNSFECIDYSYWKDLKNL